jgi:hypothetical protein
VKPDQEAALAETRDNAKVHAEASFRKKEQQLQDAQKARAEYQSAAHALDENTARLRALRLAKEAADREAGIAPAPKPKVKRFRNPRSNLR